MAQNLCDHGNSTIFLYCSLDFLNQKLESVFNTVLGQDGIICDDVGWWSGFNKGGNIIDAVDIEFWNTVEGMLTNNEVAPY